MPGNFAGRLVDEALASSLFDRGSGHDGNGYGEKRQVHRRDPLVYGDRPPPPNRCAKAWMSGQQVMPVDVACTFSLRYMVTRLHQS